MLIHVILYFFRYIPVLMAQAKIYWDMENYQQVEKVFRKSVEFCNDHDIWKLNVAHVLFMQENKFKEATGFYEPIVKKNYDKVSSVLNSKMKYIYIATRFVYYQFLSDPKVICFIRNYLPAFSFKI